MGVQIPVGYGLATIVLQPVSGVKEVCWTFGFDGDAANDPNTDAQEIDTILTLNSTRLYAAGSFSLQWRYKGVRVTRMTNTGPVVGQYDHDITGSLSVECVPINCAVLVRKNTNMGGRKGRGRMYLPPSHIPEINVGATGNIQSLALSSLQTQIDNCFTALVASDCKPVVLHSDVVTSPAVGTGWQAQAQLATQRRRMRS